MIKHRRFLKDTAMVAKPKLGHSKSRETLSNKDKKDLARILGQFDLGTPMEKLHSMIVRSRRFALSKEPEGGSIKIISNSGYKGHHDKISLIELSASK